MRRIARGPFGAAVGDTVTAAFARSQLMPAPDGVDPLVRPFAWTGFGGEAVLLWSSRETLALEQLTLSADGSHTAPWTSRLTRESRLPAELTDRLVAPPIAARTGAVLVATDQLRFYPRARADGVGMQPPVVWRPGDGASIRAAAMTGSGDVYIAVAEADGRICVREPDGREAAWFDGAPDCGGGDIGLAVRGRAGAATVYVWTNGRIRWRHVEDADAGPVFERDLPGLEAQPALWTERLAAHVPVGWHGWRYSALGAYPLGKEDRMDFLVMNGNEPIYRPYAGGRHRAFVGDLSRKVLVADAEGVVAYDPRNGVHLERLELRVDPESLILPLSSGGFISALAQDSSEAAIRGWNIRGGQIENGFLALVQNQRAPGTRGAEMRTLEDLEPLEIEDGVAIAFEEADNGFFRLRLWCLGEALGTEALAG